MVEFAVQTAAIIPETLYLRDLAMATNINFIGNRRD